MLHWSAAVRRPPVVAGLLFLSPAIVLYFGFVFFPVAMTFYNSVHRLSIYGASGIRYTYVGLQHYLTLLPHLRPGRRPGQRLLPLLPCRAAHAGGALVAVLRRVVAGLRQPAPSSGQPPNVTPTDRR